MVLPIQGAGGKRDSWEQGGKAERFREASCDTKATGLVLQQTEATKNFFSGNTDLLVERMPGLEGRSGKKSNRQNTDKKGGTNIEQRYPNKSKRTLKKL